MNKNAEFVGGHDAPIQTPADDLLDGVGVARAIHRVLSSAPSSWSTRIGLFGRWGSGKTSILNLLRTLEESDDALVVSFSAWSASGESGVIEQFYSTLAARLRDEQIELPRAQRVKRTAAKVAAFSWLGLGRTAAEEFVPLPPAVVKAGSAALDKLGATALAWTKIGREDLTAIAKLLRGRRVVVFVDDLDRADPKLVPKTLLAMRELLDWPGFAFVLAFDKRAIASALAAYSAAFGDDADGFLEKVIDVPFEVPEPSGEHQERLAHAAFGACCDLMPLSSVTAIAQQLPGQPRRVKIVARMMGALKPTLARHSPDDVDWMGLSLYLIVKEASPNVADWVVRAASDEDGDWLIEWGSDKEARRKKQEEIGAELMRVLSLPRAPDDAARVIDAALRLLDHWRYVSKARITYWTRLAFSEPAITMAEMLRLRDAFAHAKRHELVDEAIGAASRYASLSEEEASTELLKAAIDCYAGSLDSMADAPTLTDLDSLRKAAERSLLLLEHLFGQTVNRSLTEAAARSTVVLPLTGLVGKWLGWTRNDGEIALRQRERELALAAAARCVEPEAVFHSTDPYWNSIQGQDAESVKEWRATLRGAVVPQIVTRLCAKFCEVDGLRPSASGDDGLAAWLVESARSPLYTTSAFAAQLLATLQSAGGAAEYRRSTLSKNARLFLEQVMFRTRQASWGGSEAVKTIHAGNPQILPAAWAAVIESPTPYRMRSSLRELRTALVSIGVAEDQLPEPHWLAQEPAHGRSG